MYRVVTAEELDSLKSLGHFIASPNGDSVKRFVHTQSEAQDLASAFNRWEPHSVVEGRAPENLIREAEKTTFSDIPGKPMTSINVPSEKVHKIRCTGSNIKQRSC